MFDACMCMKLGPKNNVRTKNTLFPLCQQIYWQFLHACPAVLVSPTDEFTFVAQFSSVTLLVLSRLRFTHAENSREQQGFHGGWRDYGGFCKALSIFLASSFWVRSTYSTSDERRGAPRTSWSRRRRISRSGYDSGMLLHQTVHHWCICDCMHSCSLPFLHLLCEHPMDAAEPSELGGRCVCCCACPMLVGRNVVTFAGRSPLREKRRVSLPRGICGISGS